MIAFATVPVLALWGLVAYSNLQMSHERAQNANLTTARVMSRLVDKALEDTFHHLEGHQEQIILGLKTDNEALIDHSLKDTLSSSPSMAGIALYGPDGKGIIHLALVGRMEHHGDSLVCPTSPDMDWSGERWYEDYQAAGGRPVVSRMYNDPCDPDVPNTAVVIPLKDEGATVGILRASFDPTSIDEWFKPLKFPLGVDVTLLDGANGVMYDSQVANRAGQTVGEKTPVTDHPVLSEAAGRPTMVGVYVNPQTNDREIAAFMRVGNHPWSVLVRQPLTVVYAPLRAHFLKLSAAVGVLLLMGLWLGRAIKVAYARESDLNNELALLHRQTADVAITLQRSLLPLKTPVFTPFDFGVRYQSATKQALIGGDFYDFFKLDADRLGIIIGDVAGKGIGVTATSALAKNVIHAFALEEKSPAEALRRANAVISQDLESGKFITVFFGVLERSGNLTYVNCGHNPPRLFSANVHAPPSESIALCHGALPLGLGGDFPKAEESLVRINPGDLLLLYTDGLIEARRGSEFFGEQRLCELVKANLDKTAKNLTDTLFREVNEFSSMAFADDAAIVTIKHTDQT